MAEDFGAAQVRILADDGPFNKTMGRLGKTLSKTLKVGAVAGIAAFAGLGIAGANAFIGFGGGMKEVFTLLPDISGDAMNELSQQAKDFSKDFGVLPEETVPALYQAISAGVPQDNVFDFLEVANQAAVGGVTDLETAVDGISTVINSYGADVIDATTASDLMFTAVKAGKTNFEQLSAGIGKVTPVAVGASVSFDNITAALATLTAGGISTAESVTGLKSLIAELNKDGAQANTVFTEVAGVTFKKFMESGGDLGDALGLLEREANDNNLTMGDMFGSIEAGTVALALSGDKADSFRGNLDAMGDSAGATEGAFDIMETSIGRSIDKIKAAWQVFLIEVGEKIEPVISAVTDFMIENMPKASAAFETAFEAITVAAKPFLDAFGDIKDSISDFISGAEGLKTKGPEAFAALGDKITETIQNIDWQALGRQIADALITGLSEVKQLGDKVVEWITALDWTAIGTASVAAAAGFALGFIAGLLDPAIWLDILVNNWQEILLIGIGLAFAPAKFIGGIAKALAKIPIIGKLASWLLTSLKSVADRIFRPIGRFFKDLGSEFITKLIAGLGIKGGGILSKIKAILTAPMRFLRSIGETIGLIALEWIGRMGGAIGRGAGTVLRAIGSLLAKVLDKFKTIISPVTKIGKDIVTSIWNGIVGLKDWIIGKVGDFVKNIIPAPIRKILGMKSPSKVMMEIGEDTVKGLEKGISGRLGVLGDIVSQIPSTLAVTPGLGFAAAGAGGGITMINHITVHADSFADEQRIGDAVDDRIRVSAEAALTRIGGIS